MKSHAPDANASGLRCPVTIALICPGPGSSLVAHPSCFASFGSTGTALNGFPHSRQNRLARGVINPQNGHILCDWNCWASGMSSVRSHAKKATTGFITLLFSAQRNDDTPRLMILSRIAHIDG